MHRVGEKRSFQRSPSAVGQSVESPAKKACLVHDRDDEVVEGGTSFSGVRSVFLGAWFSIARVFNAVGNMFSSWVPRSPGLEHSPPPTPSATSANKDGTLSCMFEGPAVLTSTPLSDDSLPSLPNAEESQVHEVRLSSTLPTWTFNDNVYDKVDGQSSALIGRVVDRRSKEDFSHTYHRGKESAVRKVSTDSSVHSFGRAHSASKLGPLRCEKTKLQSVNCSASKVSPLRHGKGRLQQTPPTEPYAGSQSRIQDSGRSQGIYSILGSSPSKSHHSSIDYGRPHISPPSEHLRELYSTPFTRGKSSLFNTSGCHQRAALPRDSPDDGAVLEVKSSCQSLNSASSDRPSLMTASLDKPPDHSTYDSAPSTWKEWMADFKLDYKHSQAEREAMMVAVKTKLKLQQQKRMEHEDKMVSELRRGIAKTYVDSDDEGEDVSSWILSSQQHERVVMAISRGSEGECLSERYRIRVTRGDLCTLTGSMWLNDEIINFYFNLISECCNKDKGLKVHVFNSFFYPKLCQSGYGGVRRWTKKVNLFEFDLILLPVHLGMHWCLAVIDMKAHKFLYYDSLLGTNPACLSRLRNYLKSESMDKRKTPLDLSEWVDSTPQNIPSQRNGSDCGVFACMYARHSAWKLPFNFSQDDMEDIRQHMIYEILEQTLL